MLYTQTAYPHDHRSVGNAMGYASATLSHTYDTVTKYRTVPGQTGSKLRPQGGAVSRSHGSGLRHASPLPSA